MSCELGGLSPLMSTKVLCSMHMSEIRRHGMCMVGHIQTQGIWDRCATSRSLRMALDIKFSMRSMMKSRTTRLPQWNFFAKQLQTHHLLLKSPEEKLLFRIGRSRIYWDSVRSIHGNLIINDALTIVALTGLKRWTIRTNKVEKYYLNRMNVLHAYFPSLSIYFV
jgi:hypothetical protein